MGDRALIQLTNKDGEFSPVLYMHWSGGAVGEILYRAQAQMKGRANDIEYAFARLVQQAVKDDGGNTGFGVWNHTERLQANETHGDAGCFVVDVTNDNWLIMQGGGYGIAGGYGFCVTEIPEEV